MITALYVPGTLEPSDVNVTTLVVFVLLGLKLAVMPAGNPEAARWTTLENPPIAVALIVVLALELPTRLTLAADADRAKLPGVTLTATVVLPDLSPEIPLIFSWYCPTGVAEVAVRVRELVPLASTGPKFAWRPFGRSGTERFTLAF